MNLIIRTFSSFGSRAAFLGMLCLSPALKGGNMASQHRESNRQSLPLSEHQYFSKGGLGLIRDGIYIVLKSTEKNELKLLGGKHWVGSEITKPEKVVVVDGVVTSDLAAISDKTLEKVIIVSFEGDRVYFYDFANLVGGYYLRIH